MADLAANAARTGLWAGLAAVIYDPAFSTVLFYRLAARLYTSGYRRLGKLAWRLNVMLSACHIHPEAVIGPGLKLPHPTGVTIGVGAWLARNVTVYQNVTIGAGFRDGCYPRIAADVIILPNAVLVGGIEIGPRAVIGANAVVIDNVPADAVVAGNPARIIRIAPATEASPAVHSGFNASRARTMES